MDSDICVECLPVLKLLVPGVIHRITDELDRGILCLFIDIVVGDTEVVMLIHLITDNGLGIFGDGGVVYG